MHIPDSLFERAATVYQENGVGAASELLRSHGYPLGDEALRSRFRSRGLRSGASTGRVPWVHEDIELLKDLYPDPTVPMGYMVEQLRRTPNAIKFEAARLGLRRRVPLSPMPKATVLVPKIKTHKPFLVLPDVHVPYHDAAWLNRVLALAEAWGCDEANLAGDFFDAAYISHFELRDDHPHLDDEAEWTKIVLRSILSSVRKAHWTLGNHEARVSKAIQFKLPLHKIIRNYFTSSDDNIEVHDAFAMHVNDQWRIEHPNRAGAAAPVQLVSQHLLNVAVAHTHHDSVVRDNSGRFFAVRMGAIADHDTMPYCSRITHGTQKMSQGALILVPGPDGVTRHWNLNPDMDLEAMHKMYGRRYRKYA